MHNSNIYSLVNALNYSTTALSRLEQKRQAICIPMARSDRPPPGIYCLPMQARYSTSPFIETYDISLARAGERSCAGVWPARRWSDRLCGECPLTPIIGEWVALPIWQNAGGERVGDELFKAILQPTAGRMTMCNRLRDWTSGLLWIGEDSAVGADGGVVATALAGLRLLSRV